MIEIIAGRLCFEGQPLTDVLPTHLVMRLEDHLREVHDALDRMDFDVDSLTVFECLLDPDGKVWSLPPEGMRMDEPDDWRKVELVDKLELKG